MALRAYELRLNVIELVTEFEPSLPQVVADGSQLQQALLNLVLNAEQAMRGRPVKRLHVGARFDESAAAVELIVGGTHSWFRSVSLVSSYPAARFGMMSASEFTCAVRMLRGRKTRRCRNSPQVRPLTRWMITPRRK